jgi:hypothetical protein
MSERCLEIVDDGNWKAFTSTPLAVLVVTNEGCAHCRKWKDELNEFLSQGDEHADVLFGVVTLDGENVAEFNQQNKEWLDIVDGVPFNAIYVDGEPRTSFYGDGIGRLKNRLKNITEAGAGEK